MKKFLTFLILILGVVTIAVMLSSCTLQDLCSHEYTEEVIKEATCEENGFVRYTCSKCEHYYDEYPKALGHKYTSIETKVATCTSSGKVKHTCSVCHYSYDEEIAALGHTSVPIGEAVEPTCQTTGKTSGSRCSTCGATLESQRVLPIVNHVYEKGVCKWCKDEMTYRVIFESNGGTVIEAQTYKYGEKFNQEIIPTKANMQFDGWYSQDGKIEYTSDTIITTDLKVYAKWITSYAISTAEELIAISQNPTENFYLTNDIDLKGNIWTPVENFSGKLDGKGYSIKNFVLSSSTSVQSFGFVKNNTGTIKNIDFRDYTFNITFMSEVQNGGRGEYNIGVLAAVNSGNITNCKFSNGVIQTTCTFTVSKNDVYWFVKSGGVVGLNQGNGILSNCSVDVDITYAANIKQSGSYGNNYVYINSYLGGIVGQNTAKVQNCNYNANITSKINNVKPWYHNCARDNLLSVGGITGHNFGGTCEKSYADCDISLSTSTTLGGSSSSSGKSSNYGRMGGLVGINDNHSKIIECYSSGSISGGSETDNKIGGFAGLNQDSSSIESSYSSVKVNSNCGGYIGGFVGANDAVIQNSYASGDITSTISGNIGGFAGAITNAGTVSKSYSTGDVTTVGGNIGYFVGSSDGVVFKCYFMQGATLLSSGQYIDRIVEYNTIEGVLYSKLWSDEFLIDEMYWDEEGWVIVTDENPLLEWEIDISHNFMTFEVEPTCEYGGFVVYNCSDCGRFFIKDFVDPLGHNYEDVEIVSPQCEVDGYTLRRCSVCGDEIKVDVTNATGHKSSAVTIKSEKSATCLNTGLKVFHCGDCGNDFAEVIQAKGHNGIYNSTVRVATCSAEGEDEYYCITCEETYTVVTDKLEHNLIDIAGKSATCGIVRDNEGNIIERHPEDGNNPGVKCSDCDYVEYGCEVIPAHNYTLKQTLVAATCGVEGSGIYRCTICELEKTDEIAALNHTDANRDNVCDVCAELAFTVIKKSQFTHITDIEGLKAIKNNPSGYYWLDADIDLTDVDWTALGGEKQPFKGIFYGNGHTISGLNVALTGEKETTVAGLFGYNYGMIVNLNVSDIKVTAFNSNLVFGGIAAYNRGTIINCELKGENNIRLTVSKTVTEYNEQYYFEHDFIIGGIVGINEQTGRVSNCKVSGNIDSNFVSYCSIETKFVTTVWQLIGQMMIQYIYSTKVTTIQHVTFGGVVGRNGGEVADCAVTGVVTSYSSANAYLSQMKGQAHAYTYLYAGALVGYNAASIANCSAKAMSYNVPKGYKYVNVPYILTGKSYSYGYEVINYAKQSSGVEGVVGSSSSLGSIENLTIV